MLFFIFVIFIRIIIFIFTLAKVRKAAVRTLSSVIQSRPEMIVTILKECSSELISRFKEREENVRLDVLTCFTTMLQVVISVSTNKNNEKEKRSSFITSTTNNNTSANTHTTQHPTQHPTQHTQHTQNTHTTKSNEAIIFLRQISPGIISAALKLLKSSTGNVKTKSCVFTMLRYLVIATQVRLYTEIYFFD